MKFSSMATSLLMVLFIPIFLFATTASAETQDTQVGRIDDSPGYLVLKSPIDEQISLNAKWWGQVSAQSYKTEGTFKNPRGSEQNYSEASPVFMPRLEIGFNKPWSEDLTASASFGISFAKQSLPVQSAQGSLDTNLTSFLWSLRPSLMKNYGHWNLGALGEIGELYVVQSSTSLNAHENRSISFVGLGPSFEYKFNSSVSMTTSLMSRQSSKEDTLRFSALSLELGVRTQW